MVQLLRYFRTGDASLLSVWWVGALALLLPLLAAWVVANGRRKQPVAKGRALQRVDRELGLADRLTSADDFLERDSQDGFTQAAIEDASSHLARAESYELRADTLALSGSARKALWVIGGATLCLFIAMVAGWTRVGDEPDPELAQAGRAGSPIAATEEKTELPPEPEPETRGPAGRSRAPLAHGAGRGCQTIQTQSGSVG